MTRAPSSGPISPALLALASGLALAPGCTVTVPLERGVRDLRATEIRTLAMEETFTLVSPYDTRRTAELADEIRRSLAAVTAALEVEFDQPVFVQMVPLDVQGFDLHSDGDMLRYTGKLELPTRHGILGWAVDDGTPRFAFHVPRDRVHVREDGSEITEQFRFEYAETIRHELAHLAALRAGLVGPTWFDEGLAFELAATCLAGDAPQPLPGSLAAASRIHEGFELAALLDWEERLDRIGSGDEDPFQAGRPLAHSLVRFLLERTPGASLRERLERVHAMSRVELLALEGDWHAWLSDLAAP